MARRKSINIEEQIPTSVSDPTTSTTDTDAVVRRRRRRRTPAAAAPDYAQETVSLVEATLKSRGSKGATPDAIQNVVNWARGIRVEGDELKVLAARPRRLKTQAPNDRVTRYEVNRALLDGVLNATIILDVRVDGDLIFLHANYVNSSSAFDLQSIGLPTLDFPDESVGSEPG